MIRKHQILGVVVNSPKELMFAERFVLVDTRTVTTILVKRHSPVDATE